MTPHLCFKVLTVPPSMNKFRLFPSEKRYFIVYTVLFNKIRRQHPAYRNPRKGAVNFIALIRSARFVPFGGLR